MNSVLNRFTVGAAVAAVTCLSWAGPEMVGETVTSDYAREQTIAADEPDALVPAAPDAPGGPGAPGGPPPIIAAPGPYEEYFAHSAHVRRSYVPGYTPHATSLFENPRTYPTVLCVMGTPYYQYSGLKGWFFGSPRGIQSSVPENSHALAYFRGELGITSRLKHGYPQGLRVVEPVIVPFGSYNRKGGVLIAGQGGAVTDSATDTAAEEETTWFPEKGEKGAPARETLEVLEVPHMPEPPPPAAAIPLPPPTPSVRVVR